jgi:hypothetical protein
VLSVVLNIFMKNPANQVIWKPSTPLAHVYFAMVSYVCNVRHIGSMYSLPLPLAWVLKLNTRNVFCAGRFSWNWTHAMSSVQADSSDTGHTQCVLCRHVTIILSTRNASCAGSFSWKWTKRMCSVKGDSPETEQNECVLWREILLKLNTTNVFCAGRFSWNWKHAMFSAARLCVAAKVWIFPVPFINNWLDVGTFRVPNINQQQGGSVVI